MRITDKEDGRKVIAINTTIDFEAYEILQQFSPTARGYGHFISRLIFEYQARRQERERIRQELNAVGGGDHAA